MNMVIGGCGQSGDRHENLAPAVADNSTSDESGRKEGKTTEWQPTPQPPSPIHCQSDRQPTNGVRSHAQQKQQGKEGSHNTRSQSENPLRVDFLPQNQISFGVDNPTHQEERQYTDPQWIRRERSQKQAQPAMATKVIPDSPALKPV